MNWYDIWNNKHVDLLQEDNFESMFIRMKMADGYDSIGELSVTCEDFFKELELEIERLKTNNQGIDSIYEVACGCGPDLLFFKNAGIKKLGGSDISNGLIMSAKKVLKLEDLSVCEAHKIDTALKYDSVIAKGVTYYLESEEVVKKMIDLMLEKANYSVGILHILDEKKEQAYLEHRRKKVKDYDEKYKGLNKLALSKDFFKKYASERNISIEINDTYIKGYYNNEFFFDVYLYK